MRSAVLRGAAAATALAGVLVIVERGLRLPAAVLVVLAALQLTTVALVASARPLPSFEDAIAAAPRITLVTGTAAVALLLPAAVAGMLAGDARALEWDLPTARLALGLGLSLVALGGLAALTRRRRSDERE